MRSAERDPTPWLLSAALALGLVAQVLLPAPPLPLVPMHRDHALAGAAPFVLAPLPAGDAIAARPLFSPARSLQSAADVDVASAGSLALLGVAADAHGATAVVKFGADVEVMRLGQVLHGWRLAAIGRDMAALDHGDQHQRLQLGAPAANAATTPKPPTGQSQ